MIAMCKQMTYTEEELKAEPTHELERTLAAIKQVRDELIGEMWPLVLDDQRQAITNELALRIQAQLANHPLVVAENKAKEATDNGDERLH